MPINIQFKAISLNVRGLRTFEKRKTIYSWLTKQNADICFLQEAYSTKETRKSMEISVARRNLFCTRHCA